MKETWVPMVFSLYGICLLTEISLDIQVYLLRRRYLDPKKLDPEHRTSGGMTGMSIGHGKNNTKHTRIRVFLSGSPGGNIICKKPIGVTLGDPGFLETTEDWGREL